MPHNPPAQLASLKTIRGRMNDQSVSPPVQESLKQHYENLSRLADDLKNLGMDEHEIEGHVSEIFNEYERELAASIQRIETARQNREVREAS